MKVRLSLFIIILLSLGLAACGKKAAYVEPSDDMAKGAYPRTYPDVSTDPAGIYIPPAVPLSHQ